MDDVTPPVSPHLSSERVDHEGLEDDSEDVISGEGPINPSASPISDEPEELLVAVDTPMTDEATSPLQNVQKEEQVLDQEPQDEESPEELELSAKESDPAASSTPSKVDNVIIDTSAPIESVKDAVSKFGGLVVRKAHKTLASEKSEITEEKLEKAMEEIPVWKQQAEAAEEAKAQALKELDMTNRVIEELKRSLERAQAEERQAKHDSEVAKERVKEAEALQRQCFSILCEKDAAIKRAEEARSKSKEMEKTAEEMNVELASMKEALESAQVALLEAEEQRNAAAMTNKQDSLSWEKELKEAEEEMERLNQEVEAIRELKGEVNKACDLLASLKAELVAYQELKLNRVDDGNTDNDRQNNDELEELNLKIEKTREEVKCLKAVSLTLKKDLDHEKSELASLKEREGVASVDVGSLRAELERVKSGISAVQMRTKEAKDRMVKLPELLEAASREADEAKSAAEEAHEGLRKVQEEAEQAKEGASTVESRLLSVQREIEAGKASEKQAMAAMKALQESETSWSNDHMDTHDEVVVPVEEYIELRKRAQEAEEQANAKVVATMVQVDVAREAEMESVRKLEEAKGELAIRKEVYAHAAHKAELENEAKIGVEQEMRKWSAETEQRREAGDGAVDTSPRGSTEGQDVHTDGPPPPIVTNNKEPTASDSSASNSPRLSSPDMKAGKKKKHYFPRLFTYFSKKKTSPHTS